MFKKITDTLSIVSGILAVFVTIQTFRINDTANEINKIASDTEKTLKEVQIAAGKQDVDQKKVQFSRDLKFKLYDEVLKALETNNVKKQGATKALVINLMTDSADITFRDALLNTFLSSDLVDPDIRKDISENQLADAQMAEEQKVTDSIMVQKSRKKIASLPDNLKWDIDIFYLEENLPQSKERALQVQEILKAKYKTRVRVLSVLANARPGYNVSTNEIRYNNNPEEIKEAREIQGLLGEKFRLSISGKQTPWYLSVFVK
jgi:hypothetical protein